MEYRTHTKIKNAFHAIVLAALVVELCNAVTARAQVTNSVLYKLGTPSGFTNAYPGGYWGGRQIAAGGQVVGYGASTAIGGNTAAVLWTGPDGSTVNLSPVGFSFSAALGTSGTQQVGYGNPTATGPYHALLWNGSAASVVDLNPTGLSTSTAFSTNGAQQVGTGSVDPAAIQYNNAFLWNGTAASAVNLNPSNFLNSEALGTDGTNQVGYGSTPTSGYHALLWNGSAASAVDLGPDTDYYSIAYGVSGTQQVGYGDATPSGISHALLWNSSAASVIDLNPNGFADSYAFGTDGSRQVGYGNVSPTSSDNALFWSGTAHGYINLQSALPPSFVSSDAYTIIGNTVYGYATDTSGNNYAVTWTVPEPASLSLIAMAGVGLLGRRRKAELAKVG